MHKLYPLLDDGGDSASPTRDSDVLSPELRENFDAMRALIRQEKKRKDAPHDSPEGDEQLQAKKRQVAVKTAQAAEDEMSRLRNGIAELEALLAQQVQGGGVDFHAAFPALPPIVPSEEDDVVEVGNDDREDKQLDRKMVHG